MGSQLSAILSEIIEIILQENEEIILKILKMKYEFIFYMIYVDFTKYDIRTNKQKLR